VGTGEIPRSWGLLSLLALVLIIAGPSCLAVRFAGMPWKVPLAGAGLWAISILLKHPLAVALSHIPGVREAHPRRAILQGLLSAAVELSVAAVYLHAWKGASLAEVLAFGGGAGSAEALYVLGRGILQRSRDPQREAAWARAAAVSLCVRYTVPLERFFALVGHAGSRGLVYVGLHASRPLGIVSWVVALALFSAVDAVATYGHLRGWDWNDPARCRRAHLFFSSSSVIEMATFCLVFRAGL